MQNEVLDIVKAIDADGGRALLVGGFVRDEILGLPSKDYDFEIYGLTIAELENVLSRFGEVIKIGRAFGVLRVKGFDVDFSLPRRDSKTGKGHRGFLIEIDPSLSFEEAARRRDLTINSIGQDVLTGEILDPHGGRADIEKRVLRATDPDHFSEDPLRGMRVAQFAARFDMTADAELVELCRHLDFSELPGERLWEEFRKLFLKGRKPSVAFEFLRTTELIRFFPEAEAMIDVPQDPIWHPEGTVWEHTLLVMDEAAKDTSDDPEEDLVVRFAALCHDFGKPATTFKDGDRIRSPEHEARGVEPTETFLERIRAPKDFIAKVACLVRHHLAPAHFANTAKDKGYRRLARKLQADGVDGRVLYRLARSDHFGRTTPDALAREFPAGEEFLARMVALSLQGEPVRDVVLGRHLIARGFRPGKDFAPLLAACRDLQDETGWDDPQRILNQVLASENEE